ncbi:MAG: hypothetical protein ACPIOQ_07120, partial [Promethearchaeia archaeon]
KARAAAGITEEADAARQEAALRAATRRPEAPPIRDAAAVWQMRAERATREIADIGARLCVTAICCNRRLRCIQSGAAPPVGPSTPHRALRISPARSACCTHRARQWTGRVLNLNQSPSCLLN